MDDIVAWAGPLLFKPGVALLILSTSARFGQLHEELHRHLADGNQRAIKHLSNRARLLHTALISLYTSIAILAFASLIGAVVSRYSPSLTYIPESMMFVGVCAITFAAVQLIRESRLLMTVFNDDIEYDSTNQQSASK